MFLTFTTRLLSFMICLTIFSDTMILSFLSSEWIVYCNLKLINFWTNRNSKLTSFFIMLLYGFYNQKEAKKGDENHYAKV